MAEGVEKGQPVGGALRRGLEGLWAHAFRLVGRLGLRGPDASGLSVLLAVVVLFSIFRYLHTLAKLLQEAPFIDFAHYYTYATVVRLGLDPFDPHAVERVDSLLNIRRAGAAANYPPLFYPLMEPWTLLPFRLAAPAWLVFSQAALVGAFAPCLWRSASASPVQVAAALFVMLNYQPLIESLALGQANVLLLFLVTLAWWGLRTGRPWITAGAATATLFIKVQYGLLLPLLWWMGHRRAASRAVLLAGLGVGVGLAILGPAHHVSYAQYLLSPPEYLYTWTANFSVLATLHRLFGASGAGRALATSVTVVLDAGLLLLFARAISRAASAGSCGTDWAWGLGLTAILLLSPLVEEHHLVVLLLPLTLLLFFELEAPLKPADHILLVGSILLLGSRYSVEQFPAFHHGVLSLLATGKLLGTVGLAACLFRRLRPPDRPAEW